MKSEKNASPQQSNPFEELELPEGWTLTKIRDLVTINYGKGLKQADRAGGSISVYGSNGIVGAHNKALTNGPSIIIGRKGSIGEVHYSAQPSWPIDTTYYIDQFKDVDQTFLVFALKMLNLSSLDTSTAIPGLNRNDIYDQEIPFPPLAEQQRIVARVEALLSHVDAAGDRLSRVPAIMKQFRQSVLAAACSGRLTEGWRQENPNCYNEPCEKADKEIPDDWDIPEEWQWSTISEVCKNVVDCPHSTPKWTQSGRVCIRTSEIKPYYLDLSQARHVSEETYRERIQRLEPKEGDIVFSREGTLGQAAIIPKGVTFCLGQRIMLLRTESYYSPFFLTYLINSPQIFKIVNELTMGSTSLHINVGVVKKCPVPLPPLAEQHEIVRRVGLLFERADAIEREVAAAGRRCEQLTQAVLGKAFSRRLV